jgi:hypothetical protein
VTASAGGEHPALTQAMAEPSAAWRATGHDRWTHQAMRPLCAGAACKQPGRRFQDRARRAERRPPMHGRRRPRGSGPALPRARGARRGARAPGSASWPHPAGACPAWPACRRPGRTGSGPGAPGRARARRRARPAVRAGGASAVHEAILLGCHGARTCSRGCHAVCAGARAAPCALHPALGGPPAGGPFQLTPMSEARWLQAGA